MSKPEKIAIKKVHPLNWDLVAGKNTTEPLFVIKSEGAIARTREGWRVRGFELLSEEEAEDRMDVIGQNGNVGYPEQEKNCEKFCGDLSWPCTQKVQKEIEVVKNHFEETFPEPREVLARPEEPSIERPKRYASREVNGMDVIDLVKHWGLNFNEGNILKYLLRDKGQDADDMNKIAVFAKREEEYLLKNKKQ